MPATNLVVPSKQYGLIILFNPMVSYPVLLVVKRLLHYSSFDAATKFRALTAIGQTLRTTSLDCMEQVSHQFRATYGLGIEVAIWRSYCS